MHYCVSGSLEARLREIIKQWQKIHNIDVANFYLTQQPQNRQVSYSMTPNYTSHTLDLGDPGV